MFGPAKLRRGPFFPVDTVTTVTDLSYERLSLFRMVPASPSITDLMRELLALEVHEQGLRERLDALEPHPRTYSQLQRLIFRIHAEHEALERMFIGLFGVKPGRS